MPHTPQPKRFASRQARPPLGPPAPRRNPLAAVPITGKIDVDDAADVATIKSALQKQREAMQASMDQGYWLTVVFLDTAQREAFLDALQWRGFLDKNATYLDGLAIARALGVTLPAGKARFPEPQLARGMLRTCGVQSQKGGGVGGNRK